MGSIPDISIIIPVYNADKYLGKCLDSIICQDYSDFEIILINDGSSDGSGSICEQYSHNDKRIKYIATENGGASKARNRGIEIAGGKYIWFIDADDWIEKNAISKLMNGELSDITFFGFKKYKNEHEFSVCQIESRDITYYSADIPKVMDKLFMSKQLFWGYTWNKFFTSEIIKRYGIRFREDLIIAEDAIFTFEYCRYIKSLTIRDITPYNYRILGNSLSHSKRTRKNMRNLADCYEYDILPDPCFMDLFSSILKRVHKSRWKTIIEESGTDKMNEAIELYLDFQDKYKNQIELSQKHKLISDLHYRFLRRFVLKCYFKIRYLLKG